jgi:hypothetical protein
MTQCIRNYNLNSKNDIKNYSAEDISRYWQGKLTSEEMHAMERAAMDDPFLADAMEGYSTANPQQITNDLAELRERLQEKGSDKKVVPMRTKWLRVAAVIILLGGASFLTFQLLNNNKTAETLVQAKKEEKAKATTGEVNANTQLTDSAGLIQNQTSVSDTLVENRSFISPGLGSTSAKTMQLPREKSESYTFSNKTNTPAVPDLSAYKKQNDSSTLEALAKDNARRDSAVVFKTDAERNARLQENATVYRNNAPVNQSNQIPANRDNNREFYLNNFSGRVIDASNNAIPQASLRANNTNQLTVTDNNGYFNIRSGDSLLDLSVVSSGFQSRQLTLRSNQPSDVVLDPVPQKKSGKEGYEPFNQYDKKVSSKSKVDDKSLKVYPMEAEPVIGWDEYNKYLTKTNRLLLDTTGSNEVVVSFIVSKNGKLSSFNIEKSAGKEHDLEAIRLVREGPEWRVLKNRKTKARVIVTF